jgi:hypothetical protein
MAENKEIIEKLVELVEIYLENAQMNEVSTEWQEGDIDFEEVLSIVVHDGLYDLNFTEEQTNEFLALYKALNQEQVDIIEAKLNKETKKGDDIMEKEVKKTVMELNKPVKEGVRLVYNPREKTAIKEEGIPMGPDGEPLPVDVKESNTHTKLRLFRVK